MKLLQMRGIHKRFPSGHDWLGRPTGFVSALVDVDIDIYAGETLALVGESGSGKSTLARLLLQLTPADAGSIELDGETLIGLRGERLLAMRRRMQMIFQDPYSSLDPTLHIRDILAEPLRVHRLAPIDDGRLSGLLAEVGLPAQFLGRMPHELSGGQRQRVAIARALAIEPDLIACDEIVSALDVSTRAQIINLLRTLQARRGLSMLFITHDLSIVPHVAQRVAVIYLGRIVEHGFVDAIFARPAHPYTESLLAAVPVANPRSGRRSWKLVQETDGLTETRPEEGCVYRPRCGIAISSCAREIPALAEFDGRTVACHARVPDRRTPNNSLLHGAEPVA